MTKLNYKSYELAALQPSPPAVLPSPAVTFYPSSPALLPSTALFRLTPLMPYSVSLPFSLHFYYDEPSSPLSSAFSALYHLLVTRPGLGSLAPLLLYLRTFPLCRRDTALICKARTVDNIREKWRASRWGQSRRARWPDRSWGTRRERARSEGDTEDEVEIDGRGC